jgi:hypothetical protein
MVREVALVPSGLTRVNVTLAPATGADPLVTCTVKVLLERGATEAADCWKVTVSGAGGGGGGSTVALAEAVATAVPDAADASTA